MSPKELYLNYSQNPCNGTPYDLVRLVKFLKHLKYPCYSSAPHTSSNPDSEDNPDPKGIYNTGKDQLALPFKFLTKIDAEAFTEIQATVRGGTAHGIRNACDLTRACDVEIGQNYGAWEHRMATEHLEYFGGDSLTDCLMLLGPNIVNDNSISGGVNETESRAPGCGVMDCWVSSTQPRGVLGAAHTCVLWGYDGRKCASCSPCSVDPATGEPLPGDPCCSSDCVEKNNLCCKAPLTDRSDFSHYVASEDGLFGGNQQTGFTRIFLKHLGILKRKLYGGYANLLKSSGPILNICPDFLFFEYFQKYNGFNYISAGTPITTDDGQGNQVEAPVLHDRMETICVLSGSSQGIVDSIKDLLFNGYGVAIFSNVGFPNTRDSTGLSYPNKIWYHTMAIIGYDDRKIEYNECVYLIANSWGKWNSGGSPSWGPIPDGSFLVTESHLKCMLNFNQNPDFIGCKKKYCPEPCDAVTATNYASCTNETNCVPFECSKNQTAFGLAIAFSTTDGFPARDMKYTQFYYPGFHKNQENSIAYFNNNNSNS